MRTYKDIGIHFWKRRTLKGFSLRWKLTPCAWRYSTVFVIVNRTALASLSEKNFCLRILSSSSPPFISSVTTYTYFPSSYTCKKVHNDVNFQNIPSYLCMKHRTGTSTFSIRQVFQLLSSHFSHHSLVKKHWSSSEININEKKSTTVMK